MRIFKFLAFTCHEQGASSLVFAPQHQLLISAGKRGDVSLLDVRARALRHRFTAHESPVKCLAIDPHEEFFVTGSADGDIKVIISNPIKTYIPDLCHLTRGGV